MIAITGLKIRGNLRKKRPEGGHEVMKKLVLLLFLCMFALGCGTAAKQSELWEHSTMYKNWDHLRFSWCGYKKPTPETGKKSHEQGWWGIPVELKEGK